MNLFTVTGGMRGDLCSFRALITGLLQMLAYLLATRTGGIKILLRVALDLGCAATARLNFIAEIAEPIRQFRLIYSRRKLLRLEQTTFL